MEQHFCNTTQLGKEGTLYLILEARGTSGPSYMLMETNSGNAGMVKEFALQKQLFQYQTH
jgi:hypothetical protein